MLKRRVKCLKSKEETPPFQTKRGLTIDSIQDQKMDPDRKASVTDLLLGIALGLRPGTIHFRSNGDEDEDESDQNLDVARAIKYIAMMANTARGKQPATTLQRRIRFSYSRHSSYQEACHLLQTLKPKDVWPCTVNHGRWKREGKINSFHQDQKV